MKFEKGTTLAVSAALIVVAAATSTVISLKQTATLADDLSQVRREAAKQARVMQRLETELSAKLARTDAVVYAVTQSIAESQQQLDARDAAVTPAALANDGSAPSEAEEPTPDQAAQARVAIADAETLVVNASQIGTWTEHDRDRLQQLLVAVSGPERRRIESSVGQLLVEGKLVVDGDFVPL